ncbi:Uncharacterised protein [Legionella lansingensis]|uniref:Uncharacterized protein n=1 Tax=Legionella lansingensis TaxID=45067 RepID=A0A0W0V7B7_9GAMM|nr:hypothetical protein [Legionella lansingensis]KTD16005.1 hypothetical protein Llan_2593 [Legionella lansingensis]SNV56223.1 Uncharacterised protein [Legionella lansingensis]
MKTKKIPYYLLLTLLTIGASLILGFLSFGGMFALWPTLTFAFGAFVLSVAYEGEIYLQNIKGALNKLFFKHEYLKHYLANEFLLTSYLNNEELLSNSPTEDCPQFFQDYKKQLKLLNLFKHQRLDEVSLAKKRKIEKTLRSMEKWFAIQLFSPNSENLTSYEEKLQKWLREHGQSECQAKLAKRRSTFNQVKLFSLVASIFMALGTSYLLVEAFEVIPFLASLSLTTLPFLIVPMAIVAGAAYGFLTYNAVTDMINNDTLNKWYKKIRNDLSKGLTARSLFIATTAVLLLALTVALTICTAGTWWTVVKNTRPLFTWMDKMPRFVMGVIHPLVTGMSSLVFNLQNTSESLEMIDDATKVKSGLLKRMVKAITDGWANLRGQENWWQIVNPARILLKLTFTPLRIILFFGHLLSIAVTADRVPGIPQIVSALLGFISEGFEDAHYFFPHKEHDHHHDHEEGYEMESKDQRDKRAIKAMLKERLGSEDTGHNPNTDDIPTRLLKGLFKPLFVLAAAYDAWASKSNAGTSRKVLDYDKAREKQMGYQATNRPVSLKGRETPSQNWQTQDAIRRIGRFKEKHLAGVIWNKGIAQKKAYELTTLQNDLRKGVVDIGSRLIEEKKKAVYHSHRFFSYQETPTCTEDFLEKLPEQIASPAA